MTEFLLSEVDWGAHDSSFFFFLVNIDYDPKPMELFTQGLWENYSRHDRILSTTPGAEPPRDARESGAARSHSMHLETSSSDRP